MKYNQFPKEMVTLVKNLMNGLHIPDGYGMTRFIMKNALTTLLILVVNICVSQQMTFRWSEEFEKTYYNQVLNGTDPFNISDATRHEYAKLFMHKLKNAYPENVNHKVTPNEFQQVNRAIAEGVWNEMNDSHKKVWTLEKEITLRNMLLVQLRKFGFSLLEIDRLLDCVTAKTIEKFPKGLDLNNPSEELAETMHNIGRDCGTEVVVQSGFILSWTSEGEKLLLDHLKKLFSTIDGTTSKEIDVLSQCVVDKLKARYPDGLDSNVKTRDEWEAEMSKIGLDCYEELLQR